MKSSSSSIRSSKRWWRLPLILAGVLVVILILLGRSVREARVEPAASTPAAPVPDSAERVSLLIDFAEGRRERFAAVAWLEGMTVADLMNETRRADLQYAVQGTDASAFLVTIQGVSNEGAEGRNWTYTVNGKRGDRSFAVYELSPGDQVLWSFAPQQ